MASIDQIRAEEQAKLLAQAEDNVKSRVANEVSTLDAVIGGKYSEIDQLKEEKRQLEEYMASFNQPSEEQPQG